MVATQLPTRRKNATKPSKSSNRPVKDILLDLAYHLHATKVVCRCDAPVSNRRSRCII